MEWPKEFCFCISLSLGLKIFGSIEIVACIIRICFMSFLLFISLFVYDSESSNSSFIIYFGVVILVEVLIAITSVLLLIGVSTRKRQVLFTWLIIAAILYAIQIAFSIVCQHFFFEDEVSFYEVMIILTTVIRIYCWVCVVGFYKEIEEEEIQRNANVEENRTIVTPIAVMGPSAYGNYIQEKNMPLYYYR